MAVSLPFFVDCFVAGTADETIRRGQETILRAIRKIVETAHCYEASNTSPEGRKSLGGKIMQTAVALTKSIATRSAATQSDTSDEALIKAIADGDRRAMHVLYARHHLRVYRFVLRMTGREALAEDITSEAFLDVWRQADRFEARSKASTWLLAIARYKAISAMRRRQDGELDEESLALIEDPADTPEEILEKCDRSALVRKCQERLSPAHREIIDLVYYHEKSIADAAAIIGIPQATVKTRMFYARAQLANLMRQAESQPVMS